MGDRDDAFDRALAREDEIRRRIDEGELDPDDADALVELAAGADRRSQLTYEQLQRIADEGIDARALRALLDLAPSLSMDDALDVAADYGCDVEMVRDLALLGITDLTKKTLVTMWDSGVEAKDVARLRAAVPHLTVTQAIQLCEDGLDPDELEALA